ncbi:MAG: energy transducer TonB [Candidatus Gastranaerophilales bacterium]|nr:energy transducer TonB [Candidatus Gastranaerophilales bacterium]
MSDENENQQEEKFNFLGLIVAIAVIAGMVFFIRGKINYVEQAPERNDEYLTAVREQMLKDFDPSGITESGYCIVSFEINEDGWINKRQIIKKCPVDIINKKAMEMMKSATIVEKPINTYKNVPIKMEFGCIADAREASCYTKNIEKMKE